MPESTPDRKDLCRIDRVSFSYGSYVALKDVSFTAQRGEMVAVIGPSGSGKTTLLRVIAGMLAPKAGNVDLYGVQPSYAAHASQRARAVGMMQQKLDLVHQLSARHNTDAGMLGKWGLLRSLAGLITPLKHGPTTSALARVGLSGRESERVSRLSGGEQQRVAFARLLVQDPEVILADEPVSSLDPALTDELLQLLRDVVVERHRTVIASIHDPRLAQRFFDRVIGLRKGVLQFDIPSSQLSTSHLERLYERSAAQPEPENGIDPEEAHTLWGR